ncbi:BTAD domain-containing putative transcriptional regulator [Catenulispora acidiphila]|uniref:BTAD domain-containing putative transcriptional regulator n=1 Tax=Catenulispora acidiphila TaxID=304895 RepID=UPI000A07BB7D|nr:BTAD domain-containing putative transcriptional regulator [Catenulispora acidiphila]
MSCWSARRTWTRARFADLLAEGRSALGGHDPRRAGVLLTDALDLWRGPALIDVPHGPLVAMESSRLEELRLDALELRIEADLALGHAQVVPELHRLTAEHPLRERMWVLLMRALQATGRQAEALDTYTLARRIIADELGADPGAELQRLHQRILGGGSGVRAKPTAAAPAAPAAPAGLSAHPVVVPRQLPAATRHLIGRQAELAFLSEAVGETAGAGSGVVISAIGGTAGVGKTALAVHWSHQVAEEFPDGQLYVNLRGFDPSGRPVMSAQAIRGFLDAFHVSAEQIPMSLEAQAALYRSLLAGKRVLVVLDNARDVAQVRPLLPGSPGCLALITSRADLADLIAAEGAHLLTLDVLAEQEARDLLNRSLGGRLASEPRIAGELTKLCARLPLALRVTAARATIRPLLPLDALVSELRDTRSRLDALDAGGQSSSVRTAFSWSLRQLSPSAARMFRLLGLHPGPDITVAAAAGLAGTSRALAAQALAELARAHLLAEHMAGRFAFHDLLRAYAAEQAATQESEPERHQALHRMVDHYLHTARAACLLLGSPRETIVLPPPEPGAAPEDFAGTARAWAWFEAEHHVLLAITTQAAATGLDGHAWRTLVASRVL